MENFFQNINDVHINGRPNELYEIVSKMDLRLQRIAENTNRIGTTLLKLAGSNSGKAFQKAAVNVFNFSKFLSSKSAELNNMQRNIVNYINALARFEQSNEYVSFNVFQVESVKVEANDGTLQFTKNDFLTLKKSIEEYCVNTTLENRSLNDDKNNIGSFWQDSQYKFFCDFIDGIVTEITNKVKSMEDYVRELDEIIKNLP